MKRLLFAALAALIALAWPAEARGSYVYIPIYIPAGPVMVAAASPGNYDKVKRVAIISAIGKFELQKTIPIFPDKMGKLAEADAWNIDGHIKETLQKYLGGKFAFVDVAYNPEKIFDIRPTIWHAGQLTSYLKTLPNKDIDAFLVVRPNVEGGLKLQSKHMGQVVLWANYVFELIDAHTMKTIGESSSRYQVREGAWPGFPGTVLGDEFTLDDSMKLPADKIEKLHKLTLQLLDVTLIETIRSMQFGVPLPPVGDHSILPPPPTSRSAAVKSLAVYSAIGDRLQLHKPGGMLVKDLDVEVPFAEQKLDADIEANVREILGKNYSFKEVPADRAVLAKKWWGEKDGKPIVNVPPTNDVDAYLLILKDDRKILSGAGIWHDGNWVHDWTYVISAYLVILVDAHTQTPIIAASGVMSAKHARAMPMEKVSNDLWPKQLDKPVKGAPKLEALPAADAQTVRNVVLELMKDSLPETFYRLGLDTGMPHPSEAEMPQDGAQAPGEPPAEPAPKAAQ